MKNFNFEFYHCYLIFTSTITVEQVHKDIKMLYIGLIRSDVHTRYIEKLKIKDGIFWALQIRVLAVEQF